MDMSFLTIGARYTRPYLAARWGYDSHHAISRGVVTPQGEKVILLFVTRIKQESLTQYQDYLSGDLLFWEGQEKHGTDDRIIEAQKAGDEVHLFYREIHHCPFEYKGRAILLNAVRRTKEPSQFVFRLEHDSGAADDLERFQGEVEAIPDVTEREEVRKARVGQGRFRKTLLELWGSRCAVTGVEIPSVLTAAHIKPWRCASNAERLWDAPKRCTRRSESPNNRYDPARGRETTLRFPCGGSPAAPFPGLRGLRANHRLLLAATLPPSFLGPDSAWMPRRHAVPTPLRCDTSWRTPPGSGSSTRCAVVAGRTPHARPPRSPAPPAGC